MDDQWLDAEIITLIYFISRGFAHVAVPRVLPAVVISVPPPAVSQMPVIILEQFPYVLTENGSWDIDEVDCWFDSLSLEHPTANCLTSCSGMDAAIDEEVNRTHTNLCFADPLNTSMSYCKCFCETSTVSVCGGHCFPACPVQWNALRAACTGSSRDSSKIQL